MPTQVTVRPATPQDAMAVAAVLCDSRAEYVAYAPMAHTRQQVQRWITEIVIPGGGVHVATIDGRVVAMLAVSRAPEASWIDQLYVRPGFTGRGLGARLLEAAHGMLEAPIRLYTFQANADARRFYERHGYVAVAFSDGSDNEERCPDVLCEWRGGQAAACSDGPGSQRGRRVTSLLQQLRALEVELHHPGVRCGRERLLQLLHPEFHEVGRSGRAYDRETVIRYLLEQTSQPVVASDDFALAELAPRVALLTYHSAHVDPGQGRVRCTLRSSLWVRTDAGWLLRYHQGTPAAQPEGQNR